MAAEMAIVQRKHAHLIPKSEWANKLKWHIYLEIMLGHRPNFAPCGDKQ